MRSSVKEWKGIATQEECGLRRVLARRIKGAFLSPSILTNIHSTLWRETNSTEFNSFFHGLATNPDILRRGLGRNGWSERGLLFLVHNRDVLHWRWVLSSQQKMEWVGGGENDQSHNFYPYIVPLNKLTWKIPRAVVQNSRNICFATKIFE